MTIYYEEEIVCGICDAEYTISAQRNDGPPMFCAYCAEFIGEEDENDVAEEG